MTIRYALTIAETVRVFLSTLAQSRRVLTIVLAFSLLSGSMSIFPALAAGRALTTLDSPSPGA